MIIGMLPWSLDFKDETFFADKRHLQYNLLKEKLNNEGHKFGLIDKYPIDKCDIVIFPDALAYGMDKYVLQSIECGNSCRSIYFALEPPVVAIVNRKSIMREWAKIFKYVVTVQSDLDNKDNFIYFTDAIDKSLNNVIVESDIMKNKKLITSISGCKTSYVKRELYSERVKAYEFFTKMIPNEFDFYGVGWDKNKFKCYRGVCENKQSILSRYKFGLCYENMHNLNGYITEKPIDVMKAGSIPVYKGAKNIVNYIDKNCFVFADDFKSYDDLLYYLQNMSDEEYNSKLSSIQQFFQSEQYKKYQPEYYAELTKSLIVDSSCNGVSKSKAKRIYNNTKLKRKCFTLYYSLKRKFL